MRRALLAAIAATLLFATPSEASCVDGVTWRGQLYLAHGDDAPARAQAPLGDRARLPGNCGPVRVYLGKRPTPLEPDIMRWGVVHSVVGIPPAVAVMRDGEVYWNTAPLKTLPWSFRA